MNFIPGGHVVPASIQDARVEVESQLIASALAETDTQPPSPNVDIEIEEDEQDESEPSIPRMDVIPISPDWRTMPLPNCRSHLRQTLQNYILESQNLCRLIFKIFQARN